MTTAPVAGTPFLGSTSSTTRQQRRARRFTRLHRDVFLLQPGASTFESACNAVLLTAPDARLSHTTAARCWALPVDDDELVHLTRAPDAAVSRLAHVRTHRSRLRPEDVDRCHGRPVTSLSRTFVDLAAGLSLVQLVCVGDVVLRRTGAVALTAAVGRAGRRSGVVLARAALPLLDGRSASPGETRTRLLLHEAGFAALVPAVVIRDEGGEWVCEADLGDACAKVGVQYDGLLHFAGDASQRVNDVARDELARAAGWEVVVLTARDLAQPHLAIAKVTAAYGRAGGRVRRP